MKGGLNVELAPKGSENLHEEIDKIMKLFCVNRCRFVDLIE